MIMMINVALPSVARTRNRSNICTSIITMFPTRGEKHSHHARKNFFASLLYVAVTCLTVFLILT
jgi:hypothetical protein